MQPAVADPMVHPIACGRCTVCLLLQLVSSISRRPVVLLIVQVLEAVEQIAGIIKLENYGTFTLYECRRPVNPKALPEPVSDEHLLLDDNRWGHG